MKSFSSRTWIFTCLLFLLLSLDLVAAKYATVPLGPEEVVFFSGTVEGAKEKARKESKFYFIEFYARWCEPCQWMDEYTFKNASLSSYVGQHYVPVKVDVENLDGFIWKQKYKVQYLPTIVVLNANGTLLGKYEKSLAADDLMRILKNHRTMPGETYSESAEIVKTDVIPVKTNREATASFISVKREPGLPKASEVKKAINSKPLKAMAKPPAGNKDEYRVQVGVYTDATNVVNQVSKLKKSFTQIVQVFNLKNKETNSISYRITLGKFYSREEAAQFALTLKSQGITGVIKHISELEQKP